MSDFSSDKLAVIRDPTLPAILRSKPVLHQLYLSCNHLASTIITSSMTFLRSYDPSLQYSVKYLNVESLQESLFQCNSAVNKLMLGYWKLSGRDDDLKKAVCRGELISPGLS